MAETDTTEARRRSRRDAARPRNLEADYRTRETRKTDRAARGERPRIEEATTIEEALEAERAAGRAEATRQTARQPAQRAPSRPPAPSSAQPRARRAGVTLPASEGVPPSVTAPMVVETILVTADEWVTERRFPLPSRLLVVFAFFGALGMARGAAAKPAAALGWGIVAASFYASVAPSGQPSALRALAVIGDFVSGKVGAAPAGTYQPPGAAAGSPIPGASPLPAAPGQVG